MMKITSQSKGSSIPRPNSEATAIARPNSDSPKMSFQFIASILLFGQHSDRPIGLDYVFHRRVRNQHMLWTGGVSRDLIRIEGDPQTLPGDRPGLVIVRARRRTRIYRVITQH